MVSLLYNSLSRSPWLRRQRCGSAAARLLILWVRIPPEAWTFVCCEYNVCCQVEVSATSWSLVQRGVLPTVVRRWVWSRNLVNEEALAHWGVSRQKQTNNVEIKLWYLLPISCNAFRHWQLLVLCFHGVGKTRRELQKLWWHRKPPWSDTFVLSLRSFRWILKRQMTVRKKPNQRQEERRVCTEY